MAQEAVIKQLEVRANSHGMQLQGMRKRVEMLAQGGEWMETEVLRVREHGDVLQKQVEELRDEKERLEDKLRGLDEEVQVLEERDGVWERKLTLLEEPMNGGAASVVDSGLVEMMDRECVLSAARFAVGNYRVFPGFH